MNHVSEHCYVLRDKKGFTLIELIIAVAMMAMLSAITISNFRSAEKQKRLAFASDILVNAIRSGQNFGLTSKQIPTSNCIVGSISGKSAKSFIVQIGNSQALTLYAIDKCDVANVLEAYTIPQGTRIKANSLTLDANPVSDLQIKFTPPFSIQTASSSATVNQGAFASFNLANVSVELLDGSASKTVIIDGISGKIGEWIQSN